MRAARRTPLYYEPFMISRYDCAEIGVGVRAHKHSIIEPCHFTVIASGEVVVKLYDDDGNEIGCERYAAPSIIDYNDGKDRHHSIEATMPGTTFFNIPRAVSKKDEIVSYFEV